MAAKVRDKALIDALSSLALDGDPPSPSLSLDLATLGLDGCVVDGVLTAAECAHIIDATEKSGGFSFWDPEGADAKKRSHRNADTCEFSGAALCASLWPRLQPFVAARWSLAADASEARCHEPELEGGEWVATGLNEHLLVNRYGAGGHFAPHADGSTVVDFNRRSLFTVLVYLNDVAEGGATQLLSEEERECAIVHDPLSGAAVASAKAVLHAVAPRAGRALVYWHQTMHAGAPVGAGCAKYCVRSDVMYERVPPRLTAPNERRAFETYQEALALEAAGDAMAALPLYMRVGKLSAEVARVFRLV